MADDLSLEQYRPDLWTPGGSRCDAPAPTPASGDYMMCNRTRGHEGNHAFITGPSVGRVVIVWPQDDYLLWRVGPDHGR